MIVMEAADDPVEGDDPDAVRLMITCLYSGDYQAATEQHGTTGTKDEHDDVLCIDRGPCLATTVDTLDQDGSGDEISSSPGKRKKRKGGTEKSTWCLASSSTDAASPRNFLGLHARLFALGSKYEIPQLHMVSLAKFRIEMERTWQQPDFIKAIRIAFETAPETNGLRDIIKSTIVEKGSQLANDPDFNEVVGDIPGLGTVLFEQKCQWADAQRVCSNCKRIYLSQDALAGPEGDVYHLNSNGRCDHCCNKPFGSSWSRL